jgi:hypothetical protein
MTTTPVPSKIGKYDVVGVIGRGGMGVVYQAMDPHLDRKVAIKMITGQFSENPDMLKRFFREAQSLGSLQHPNIVTVFDLGDFGGNPYFVMEFLEGEGLDSLLAKPGQLNLLEKIGILIQVCNGLGYAHRRGVVHRDIKPANIMISKDGGVKIFDFGIAHAGQTNVTRTGEVIGTLRYMAPEQVNSKGIDSRTDIFSTGVVLYQLMTDHLPFDGENTASTLMKIVSAPPPPLGDFLSAYPPEMEEILLKALAKNPNERYSTAEDFALDLAQLQGQLKEELIGRDLEEVAALIDRGEIYKAQGTLLRVLKIDQQHTRASRLLREVQQRIQRDELSTQVRGLREWAEEALADEQFDRALEHVERALSLDCDNFDLLRLKETIREAAMRAEKLHKALKAAESAQAEGNLEAAKQAAEAALAMAPNDTQARTVHRMIIRDIEERARQQQMEGYLQEARQELSSRRFTAALMILKRAEELDPAAPQLHSLMESAVAGQEQERCRRELEALTHEVEEALNTDDYRTASRKADEGLARFPNDRTLLKLKGLADRQRQIEERKQLVDGLVNESRMLLQAGRHEELKDKLERALAQLGPDARLQSLLGEVERQRAAAWNLEQTQQKAIQTPAAPENPARSAPPTMPPAINPDPPDAALTAPFNALHEQRPIGPGEGLTTKVRQILRDTTLFGKAPPADNNAADIAPAVASDELQEAYLPIIERHLAAFVGPLAKVHVNRAATKTTSVLELYTMLSANLQKEEDRKAFLARRAELAGGRGSAAFTKLATPAVSPSSPPPADLALPSEITAAAVEQIAKRLAAHLGPIAPVLARREAKCASSLQEFYELLAEHIVNPVDRQRFLKEAGIGKEPPPGLTARRSL